LIITSAVVVGVALGLPAGSQAWSAFAQLIGVPYDATSSAPLLLLVVGLAFVGAALTALPPARSALRMPAATVLRQG
jgi:predicted lysophospholipase L1 biosynthesis ABC-type transport system permease subunit